MGDDARGMRVVVLLYCGRSTRRACIHHYHRPSSCGPRHRHRASGGGGGEAAFEILLGSEVSAIWWADDGYGVTLNSLYDNCTITVYDGTEWCDFDKRDKESVQLDQQFGEISWEGHPEIYLYDFLNEVVGSELTNVFLKHASPEVCLRRIYDTEECQRHLPQRIENSSHELWDNVRPAWSIRSRN